MQINLYCSLEKRKTKFRHGSVSVYRSFHGANVLWMMSYSCSLQVHFQWWLYDQYCNNRRVHFHAWSRSCKLMTRFLDASMDHRMLMLSQISMSMNTNIAHPHDVKWVYRVQYRCVDSIHHSWVLMFFLCMKDFFGV